MLQGIGAPELLIILAIVIVLFGVGRVGKVGGELGEAIGAFRRGLKAEEQADSQEDETKS